jgi:beta-galactosidase/beta-glucuronidase
MTFAARVAVLIMLIATHTAAASDRQSTNLNAYWRFSPIDDAQARRPEFDDSKWLEVTLPHTFNGGDGEDGGAYFRGAAWYRHGFGALDARMGRVAWLQIDGAALSTQVYVNGSLAGEHDGGYARFRVNITSFLQPGRNVLALRVDNSRHPHVAPLGGDFTVFGGLYRDVSLLTTGDVHIDLADHGGPGVYVSTRSLTDAQARITVRANVRNTRDTGARVIVTTTVRDAEGHAVARGASVVGVRAGTTAPATTDLTIENPRRWRGVADPHLYRVTTQIKVRGESATLDHVSVPLGLRTTSIDPARGFMLNGEPYPLHGVNLFHSGRPGRGLAVTADEIRQDFAILKELGVTGVRFVHFQHPPLAYEEADRLGFVVWTEIPLNGAIDPGRPFLENLEQQARELVRQNGNHPSVAIWGLGNEVYAVNPDVNRVLAHMQRVFREEDPSRPTTYAHCCQSDDDEKAMHSDTIAFNRYFGWYPDQKGTLGGWARQFHEKNPTRAFAVGEYGAGASIRHQELAPRMPETTGGWHPEQYQALFHEKSWQEIADLDFLWGKFVWVAFDLASNGRSEGDRPGINDKGLVTHDRAVRKDAFYYYKAQWSREPMLHLTSKRLGQLREKTVTVKAYTNAGEVDLIVNGELRGKAQVQAGIASWTDVELAPGGNEIVVTASVGQTTLRDAANWELAPPAAVQ